MAIRGVGGIHEGGEGPRSKGGRWVGQRLLWIGHRWSHEILISSGRRTDGSSVRIRTELLHVVVAGMGQQEPDGAARVTCQDYWRVCSAFRSREAPGWERL